MLVPVRLSIFWSAVIAAALFASFVPCGANAQEAAPGASSVETYVNEAVPYGSEGLMPEGVEWNKPLKAGDLVLPKKQKLKAPPLGHAAQRPSLPIGEVKAPRISSSEGKTGSSSSASLMLLQGMKNALQQAGENLNIPVASSNAQTAQEGGEGTADLAPIPLSPPRLQKNPSSELKYEPGREPRNLAEGAMADVAAKPQGDSSEISSKEAPAVEDAPPPDTKDVKLAAPKPVKNTEEKTEKPSKESTGFFGSIFGPSVDEKTKEKQAVKTLPDIYPEKKTDPEPVPAVAAASVSDKTCETKVTPWTRACGEAGYPSHYVGQVTGETRIECPSGDAKEEWLSNTCAPSASEMPLVPPSPAISPGEPPRVTDLKEAPKTLASSEIKPVDGKAASAPSAVAVTPSAVPAEPDVRVDANCGAANGMAVSDKPVQDLCAAGGPSSVSGEGPWLWSCKGLNGGITVSCAAPAAKADSKKANAFDAAKDTATEAAAPVNGKCGAADGAGAETAPSADLCSQGIASRVNGGGPWTWACSGTNGGRAAACSAPKKVDGTCGAVSNSGADSMPERDLCASGYASAVTGEGPWNWTCSGIYGGSAATCTALNKVNAVCGPSSLTGHRSAPTSGLCKAGDASQVEGEGPWTWSCSGAQGGAAVSCKAPVMADGECGAANGGLFDKAPEENLCVHGVAGRVTGNGPWSWNCAGLEGGNTVSCTALAANGQKDASPGSVTCGASAETAAFQAPTENLCTSGTASAVTGEGPWGWSCSGDDGQSVACSTLKIVEGACGTAANVPSVDAPSDGLCADGTAGRVTSDKGKKNWSWDCRGQKGGSAVSCSAPVLKKASESDEAKCGAAAGRSVESAPKGELCDAGKASSVRGSGPWTWTCSAKSGRKIFCEAPKTVEGACGPANGSIQKSTPLTGLCSAGTPTDVNGEGPWLWSCVGTGGGASVSCSAAAQSQARVDGSCGAASNAVMTHAPEVNLCDTGVPSSVHGEGPWTWTCSGMNGGIASTCATSKVVPKAPPPPGPLVNGNCGPANGVAAVVQPKEGLCSSGTATGISGDGPWNWNCLGDNGGMSVSCTAPLMPPAPIEGVCGPANGVPSMTMPKSGLCSAGIASAASGKGPWTWSCSGTNGGGAVSCVAPVAGKTGAGRPLPSTVTPSSSVSDEAPAPMAAPAGLVTPKLPENSLTPLESGALPQLTPSKPLPLSGDGMSVEPSRESGALTPPPVRDTVPPPPSKKPPEIDAEGKVWPGARIALDSDVSSFSFDRGSDAIDKDMADDLDKLAAVLKTNAGIRITLNAYAGGTGDTLSPREARRLSLARALNVRDYLTSKGISSSRIDVRALGANVPSGDMDRVDVKVN